MSSLILTLSPFVTSAIVGFVKGLKPFKSITDLSRKPIIRTLGFAVALLYSVVGLWITGDVDEGSITVAVSTLGEAVIAWVGSMGVFHAWFSKKN